MSIKRIKQTQRIEMWTLWTTENLKEYIKFYQLKKGGLTESISWRNTCIDQIENQIT
jgi:hypothetical protein